MQFKGFFSTSMENFILKHLGLIDLNNAVEVNFIPGRLNHWLLASQSCHLLITRRLFHQWVPTTYLRSEGRVVCMAITSSGNHPMLGWPSLTDLYVVYPKVMNECTFAYLFMTVCVCYYVLHKLTNCINNIFVDVSNKISLLCITYLFIYLIIITKYNNRNTKYLLVLGFTIIIPQILLL